jgi:hypothetical protein
MDIAYKDIYHDMLIKGFVYHRHLGVLLYLAPHSRQSLKPRRSTHNRSRFGKYFIVGEV